MVIQNFSAVSFQTRFCPVIGLSLLLSSGNNALVVGYCPPPGVYYSYAYVAAYFQHGRIGCSIPANGGKNAMEQRKGTSFVGRAGSMERYDRHRWR